MEIKQKNYNLEIIRVVSAFFVVAIHVANYYCRRWEYISDGQYIFSVIINTLARFSVPCFFLISGSLLMGRQESLGKHGKRLWHFARILVFWSLFYYIFNILYVGKDSQLDTLLVEPVKAHLWYLYALIPIYLILPFIQVMVHNMDEILDKALIALCLVSLFLLYFLSLGKEELYYDIPLIGDRSYSVYFFMGYYIKKYAQRIRLSTLQLTGIFLGCTCADIILTLWMSFSTHNFYERFLEYGNPLVFLSGISLFMLLYKLQDGHMNLSGLKLKIVTVLGNCGLGIYLIHVVLLDIYKKNVDVTTLPSFVGIPLLTIGIFAASFFFVYLLKKIPLIQKVF